MIETFDEDGYRNRRSIESLRALLSRAPRELRIPRAPVPRSVRRDLDRERMIETFDEDGYRNRRSIESLRALLSRAPRELRIPRAPVPRAA